MLTARWLDDIFPVSHSRANKSVCKVLVASTLPGALVANLIVVSHDMQCALAIADRIVVLDKGNVVEQGTVAEIRASQVPLILEFLEEAR